MGIPSIGIKDLLLAKGYAFGGSLDWAVYIGKQPDSPDNCVTIYDSGGGTPSPLWLLDYPHVQVRVRSRNGQYQEAMVTAKDIKSIILGQPSQDLNGDRWVQFNLAGDIGFMGYDKNERPEFVLNFELIIEPAATAHDNREPL